MGGCFSKSVWTPEKREEGIKKKTWEQKKIVCCVVSMVKATKPAWILQSAVADPVRKGREDSGSNTEETTTTSLCFHFKKKNSCSFYTYSAPDICKRCRLETMMQITVSSFLSHLISRGVSFPAPPCRPSNDRAVFSANKAKSPLLLVNSGPVHPNGYVTHGYVGLDLREELKRLCGQRQFLFKTCVLKWKGCTVAIAWMKETNLTDRKEERGNLLSLTSHRWAIS